MVTNGILFKTRAILLTVLFERQQSFGDTAHRRFQLGEEDVVNELQAFDKITIKYEAYTTIIRNRAAICLPLIRTVDFIPSILCEEILVLCICYGYFYSHE